MLSVLKNNPLYGTDGESFQEKVEDFIDELEDMEASLDFDKSLVFEGREDEVTNILNTFSRTDSSKEIGSQHF